MRRILSLLLPQAAALLLLAAPANADFGLQSFENPIFNRDGTPDAQAGSHPWQMVTGFNLDTTVDPSGETVPDGDLKDSWAELPPGLLGNPAALAKCTQVEFQTPNPDINGGGAFPSGSCPDNTEVGIVHLSGRESGLLSFYVGLYNLVPPFGEPAQFGFNAFGTTVVLIPSLRSRTDYGVTVASTDASQAFKLEQVTVTLWGVPGDPAHDPLRGECLTSIGESQCSHSFQGTPRPFLSLPTQCNPGPLTTTIHADSWEAPARLDPFGLPDLADPNWKSASYQQGGAGGQPALFGCDRLDFAPSLTTQTDAPAADSPTGLHVDLHLPQPESPTGLAEAHLRDATVTLPEGLDVNPSSANGLAACSPAQIGLTSAPGVAKPAYTPVAATCPDAAKLGTVEVDTPLLEKPLSGAVYLAQPFANPFNSLLAIYIAVDDPQTGVILKLAGQIQADPITGRLTTTFDQNPQLPFEDLRVDFFAGPRASLRTPTTCGSYQTTTDLTPWTSPEGAERFPSSSFAIDSGPGGSACANSPPEEPNGPSFEAGALTPIAGAYSSFVLKLSREDGSQELQAIDTTLPPGLLGKLAGLSECSEAQLAAAANQSGAAERANPSCPAASQLGTVNVGVGAGPDPYYVQGHAYLSGPYKSAPLSLAIITPALAGPFDLGTVVVRAALYVNPQSAQISAVSDPLPTILQGIPLDLRSVALSLDRPRFTLNPTNCDPLAIQGSALSVLGHSAALSERFQVGGCGALPFKPKLAISLKGATHRRGHPALRATLTARPGEANIASAQLTLPPSELLDNAHIATVCTRVQFSEGAGNGAGCPPASIYGHARAITPLLDQPLEGPVYLRSSTHTLPDLVAALNGQIDIALDGRVDSGRGGGIRNTFEVVPDAPVAKFTLSMQGGAKGLLENSENFCTKPQKAIVHFTAQNGKLDNFKPTITNSCKAKPHHKRRGAH